MWQASQSNRMHFHLPPLSSSHISTTCLGSTALHDGRRAILVLDRTAAGAAQLEALHNGIGLLVAIWDLAEDNVPAIEPGGDDGSDEELGAVGVGAGVGHGEHEGLLVCELEVLVCELLAVDGFAARALFQCRVSGIDAELERCGVVELRLVG